MSFYSRIRFVSLCSVLVLLASCEKGEVIEEIGGSAIRTEAYEEDYATAVEIAARLAGSEKSTLYRLVCNPSMAPNAEAYRMALTLRPDNHYDQYRDTLMIVKVAEEEGFLDRPIVQKILEQSRMQTIAQLYINEQLQQKIKISEEDKAQGCEELRRKHPAKLGPLPLEDCMKVAEGALKRNIIQQKGPEVVEDVKEKIAIRKNPDFNKEEYLEKIELYQTIRREGGCSADPESDEALDQSPTSEQ